MFSFVHLQPTKRINYTFAITLFLLAIAVPLFGQSITVTKPTSSAVWIKDSPADIEWDSTGSISKVKIELYKGDTFNQTIVQNTPKKGSYTWKKVDKDLADGSDYKVRISSVSEPGIYDESEEFTIEEKSITVTEPKSSTVWTKGASADITWIYTGVINNVKIDLYKTGTFNQTIVDSTTNNGSYSWAQVNPLLVDGSDYKVRISWVSDTGIYDESEEFTIEEKSITVTEPKSSTVWTKGASANIAWTSTGTISDVKIDLYKTGTFNQTIVDSTTNNGSYSWAQVDPSLADGSDYKVRISWVSDSGVYDESDEFTIEAKSITVTEPTSSTIWTKGTSANITWTSSGTISDVQIDLYKAGAFQETIESSANNDGSYSWTQVNPSLVDGSDYKVRISSVSDSGVYDESDEFTIEAKSITVTEPTSSTIWTKGDSANVTWTYTGVINNVKIDLYKTGTFNQTIVDSTTNNGSYTWTVDPSLADDSDYKVKVSDASDSGVYDESEEFEISAVKSITVTEPTSSTIWTKGTSANITWTSSGTISDVQIELYKKDKLKATIAVSTVNDGSYTWAEVDTNLKKGKDYKVKISWVSDPGVYSESEEFEIK